ncbi:heterokaryon incompatibility protein-domain-containing protein [Pyrenochaeta sp. MPI-SDFR-AT-0127]|nr:heterokaryon incompatibility protein-domain-containing protein [Pyrenochaeta sp. MPI-SDFR-AT-0127]
MDRFEYQPIDLQDSHSFRLVRLYYGDYNPIQCELFDAWLDDKDSIIEYDALSYRWEDEFKSSEIEVNERKMLVTENLSLALLRLRYRDRDRILWVDAICINQSNDMEKGHQVQQMASIYKRAEQVVVWLGQSTYETDLVFRHMCQLEKEALEHACNDWQASDPRWQNLWVIVKRLLLNSQSLLSDNQPLLDDAWSDLIGTCLRVLLNRTWFRRVWIIQEVANARSARIICGAESVSARIFAIFPSIVGIIPDPHCQAVLEIMPGPSRKHSWWTKDRDLYTLLQKFKGSEATIPRDVIYALRNISSDVSGSDILIPDYEKSEEEVVRDTVAFLLGFRFRDNVQSYLPLWTLSIFLQSLDSLAKALCVWAIDNGQTGIINQLLYTVGSPVGLKGNHAQMLLCWAAETQHKAEVKFLLDTGKVDVNLSDQNGQTPIDIAMQYGYAAIVQLLLNTGKVDVNQRDQNG